MGVTYDSFAMLLLCSDLALKTEDVRPFTVSQWTRLEEALTKNLLTPAALFDFQSLRDTLSLSVNESERIERLLSRSEQLGIALSKLNDKGVFTLTKCDQQYPIRLKAKLKKYAPVVLYYSGNLSLLENKGVAIVGSRNADNAALRFASDLAQRCVQAGVNIISGGAKGVDSAAEAAAVASDGSTVIVTAEGLAKKLKNGDTNKAISNNRTLFLSQLRPDMTFQAYAAIARNRYIYALSDIAVAVSSEYGKGGTWTGAMENLKNNWTPLFVRESKTMPQGNAKLLKNETVGNISENILADDKLNIYNWFCEQMELTDNSYQLSLFAEL